MRYICLLLLCLSVNAVWAAEFLPANPWAGKLPTKAHATTSSKAPNTLEIKTPDWVGSNTTWNTAMGQEEIAPDVNITNILLMTQHLRNLGYQIPDGLDTLINTAPEKLRREIMGALQMLKRSGNPVAVGANAYVRIFESRTGLSIQNLIENSLNIIDARR